MWFTWFSFIHINKPDREKNTYGNPFEKCIRPFFFCFFFFYKGDAMGARKEVYTQKTSLDNFPESH